MSSSSLPIRVLGVYTCRADVTSMQRPTLEHRYELTETDAKVEVLPEQTDAAAAMPPSSKPQRLTANTWATKPSDIPRTCPTDSTLTQLVSLLHQAKSESDRYLTQLMKEEEDRRMASLPPGDAANPQKKRKNAKDEDHEGDGTIDKDGTEHATKKTKLDG